MVYKWVLKDKKTDTFVTPKEDLSSNIEDAELYNTRKSAREIKFKTDVVKKVKVTVELV